MKRAVTVVIVVLMAGLVWADSYNIGGKDVEIPSPEGFSLVTPEMTSTYELSLSLADPQNDLLACFISDSEIPTAMNGEIPLMERYFLVKVDKRVKGVVATSKDFAEFKTAAIGQNANVLEWIKSQLPDPVERTGEEIGESFDVDSALQISQMVPLEPHWETENGLSYSMYLKIGVEVDGNYVESPISVTATFVNAAGQLVFLYCYGPVQDLEWTRTASVSWAESILSSNSAPEEKSSGGN